MSTQSRYPNTVGKKVGERSDGMIVLEFKRGRKRAYLPENLELVRLPLARLGEKGCCHTQYYEVIRGPNRYHGRIGQEVQGLKSGKVTLLFDDGGQAPFPLWQNKRGCSLE